MPRLALLTVLLASTLLAPFAWAEAPANTHAAQPRPVAAPPVDLHEPVPGKEDPRIRTWLARPGVVLRLKSTNLVPVRVVFEPGEVPAATAGQLVGHPPEKQGDPTPQNWIAYDNPNDVLLQPLRGLPLSYAFLNTVQNGEQRHYVIELRTRTGPAPDKDNPEAIPDDPDAYLQVTISHPAPAPTGGGSVDAVAARARRMTNDLIDTRLTQARFGSKVPRNWKYVMHGNGCATFAPVHNDKNWISDDGHETAVVFFGHKRPPVVTTRDDEGEPELITPTVFSVKAGTVFILPDTYPVVELARGKLVCELKPKDRDDEGTVRGGNSGTITPDVVLTVKPPKRTTMRAVYP